MFKLFQNEGKQLYLVGGAVRDQLLNKMIGTTLYSGDMDYCTDAIPEEIIRILEKNNLPVIPIGIEFGTVATIFNNIKVEITTFRCAESYKKGSRKPQVVFGKSIEEDLARRDLTINAMAMDINGNIIDPFNGQNDLRWATIRTPLHPNASFTDDPLRLLRCVRFVSKLNFGIDIMTFEGIKSNAQCINNISVERIFEEMNKLLSGIHVKKALAVLLNSGLMKQIFPELYKVYEFKNNQGEYHHKDVFGHILDVVGNSQNKSEIRWAAMLHDVAKPDCYFIDETGVHFYGHDTKSAEIWNQIANRLKVSNEFKNHVKFLIAEHMNLNNLCHSNYTDKALRKLIFKAGDKLDDLIELCRADCTSLNPKKVEHIMNNLNKLIKDIKETIGKEDVRKLKLPSDLGKKILESVDKKPGPWLGQVMKQLKIKLIEGELNINSNFVEEALKLVRLQEYEQPSEEEKRNTLNRNLFLYWSDIRK